MSELNIFEQGTRFQLRFCYKGLITIEDLWILNLEVLDEIAVELYRQVQQQVDISFINASTKSKSELQLKLEIVKRIIQVKLEERENAKMLSERRAKKQKIMELIDSKQNQALSELSIEELQKQLDEL